MQVTGSENKKSPMFGVLIKGVHVASTGYGSHMHAKTLTGRFLHTTARNPNASGSAAARWGLGP